MTTEKIDGSMLLDTIERRYFGFGRRRRDVRQATSCDCNACVRILDLDLKFVVHQGSAILHKVAGRQVHGKDAVVEEILDWRPYDYVTDRTILATPDGPLRVLHTIELEPTTTGTTIHMRFAAPKATREAPLMNVIGPAYAHALESRAPNLVAQLDAELAVREANRAPEPELMTPRTGGALANLQPFAIDG